MDYHIYTYTHTHIQHTTYNIHFAAENLPGLEYIFHIMYVGALGTGLLDTYQICAGGDKMVEVSWIFLEKEYVIGVFGARQKTGVDGFTLFI